MIEQLNGAALRSDLKTVSFKGFATLPAPVARYFRLALKECQPLIRTAHIQQHGEFWLKNKWISLVRSVQMAENYLRIVAPFDGVITERNAHKGPLAGPAGAAATSQPVLRIQQVARLRLIVSVPEAEVAAVRAETKVNFTFPAFSGETFTGTIARIGNSVDPKTRTMPIELDVNNPSRRLSLGMFPQVLWPTSRPRPSLTESLNGWT